MLKLITPGALLLCSCFLVFTACRKNAAPTVSPHLTDQEKTQLVAKVRNDTLYKEFRANQKKGFELMKIAVQSGKIDTSRLKMIKHTGRDADFVSGLKEAGMFNAEEFQAINRRNTEILKELWKKYPGLEALSQDDLIELGKQKPSAKQKP